MIDNTELLTPGHILKRVRLRNAWGKRVLDTATLKKMLDTAGVPYEVYNGDWRLYRGVDINNYIQQHDKEGDDI